LSLGDLCLEYPTPRTIITHSLILPSDVQFILPWFHASNLSTLTFCDRDSTSSSSHHPTSLHSHKLPYLPQSSCSTKPTLPSIIVPQSLGYQVKFKQSTRNGKIRPPTPIHIPPSRPLLRRLLRLPLCYSSRCCISKFKSSLWCDRCPSTSTPPRRLFFRRRLYRSLAPVLKLTAPWRPDQSRSCYPTDLFSLLVSAGLHPLPRRHPQDCSASTH
jgi:hypothetical protein